MRKHRKTKKRRPTKNKGGRQGQEEARSKNKNKKASLKEGEEAKDEKTTTILSNST